MKKIPIPNDLLRKAREERGWTQRRLAEEVGVEEQTVRSWERGTRFPSLEFRRRLCEIFSKTPEQLGLQQANAVEEITKDPVPLATLQPLQGIAAQRRDENRQRMLQRVRARWITGILDHSLYHAILIALGLQEQPDAVENPWQLEVRESNLPPHTLPAGTSITQVYDDSDSELLILGEPGAGKTTLLLALARDLLDRAFINEHHPIPVVFNLSSWAIKRQPLTDWLIEELNSKYQVPHKLAHTWVTNDNVLLLLDGLDEVAEEQRIACIDTVNTYRSEHGLVPMVICSRRADYLAQAKRLQMHTAVLIQPLTRDQIETYLSHAGNQLEAVRLVLQHDPDLQELATSPLMLSVLALTYAGKSVDDLQITGIPLTARRQQIFADYVQRMLQRRGTQTGHAYTSRQTTHWLAWLARQLAFHNQTEFYVERMQPDWLPDKRSHQRHRSTVVRLIYGSNYMIVTALFGWLRGGKTVNGDGVGEGLLGWLGSGPGNQVLGWMAPGLGGGISGGGTVGLVFGIASVLIGITAGTGTLKTERSWAHTWKSIVHGMLNGLKVMVVISLFVTILFGSLDGLTVGLYHGLAYGLIGGLMAGLYSALVALKRPEKTTSERTSAKRSQAKQRSLLLTDGFIIVLCAWFGFAIVNGLYVGFSQGIAIGAVVGLFTGLLFMVSGSGGSDLLPGLGTEIKPAETVSWSFKSVRQTLFSSIRRGLAIGLSIMLIVTVVIGLASALFHGLVYGWLYGLVYGLIAGLVVGVADTLVEILNNGWSSDVLDKRQFVRPNEGIRRSMRNSLFAALLFGPIGGIISGLLCGLAFGLIGKLDTWPTLSIGFAILFGCLFALEFWSMHGGNACIEHVALRLRLWHAGYIPWNYIRFLDYAAERILLRKTGGGYIFVHRLLLEYFATLDPEKSKDAKGDADS